MNNHRGDLIGRFVLQYKHADLYKIQAITKQCLNKVGLTQNATLCYHPTPEMAI
jgi:hypothetical protein